MGKTVSVRLLSSFWRKVAQQRDLQARATFRWRSIWAVLLAVSLTSTITLAVTIGLASATGPWYASPTGSGGCTSSTDTCSISTAISDANTAGGGTVILESGTYSLGSTLAVSPAGSITIQADTGASPVLNGNSTVQVMTIASTTTATVEGVTIENGVAINGGGISNSGHLTVMNSTFTGNSVTNSGGALFNNGSASSMTVEDSTIENNNAVWVGGGFQNFYGNMKIENSTITANAITTNATGHFGAGINNYQGTVYIESSTLANNTTGASTNGGNAIFAQASGTVYIAGSIITGSGSSDCASNGGTISDKGYNIANDSTCGLSATGSISNSPFVNLGTLASNGGPTQTIKPLTSSAGVGAIPDSTSAPSGFPNALCPSTDQTGTSSGTSPCSMGAVFVVPISTYYVAPTSGGTDTCGDTSDPCTVQNAITVAKATGDTVNFATGTYSLTATLAVSLAGSLTLQGESGATPVISGGNLVQVISIASGSNVTINGLTIENGYSSGPAAGIGNAGTLKIENSTVTNNKDVDGVSSASAGLYNTGTATVTNSTFSSNNDNNSQWGSAIDSSTGATISISGSTFSSNLDNGGCNCGAGGALSIAGSASITYSTFYSNQTTGGNGGAIVDGGTSGTLTLIGDTFVGNSSASLAGGYDVNTYPGMTLAPSATIFADAGACKVYGTLHDYGYNAARSGSACVNGATGDITDTGLPGDLGSLANNGGPTLSVKPNTGAPEIGAIANATSGLCPEIDQTGAKSNDENCTIGSLFVASTTAPPSSLSASGSVGSVSLSWSPPSTNGASTVTGYNIYMGPSSGGESSTPINASPVTGTSYVAFVSNYSSPTYFKVKAVDPSGTSGYSNEASATAISPPPPPQPTSTSLTTSASTLDTGQSVIFEATVSSGSGTPSGTVNFYSNGSPISGCISDPLGSSGLVSCTTSFSGSGTYSITATYNGTGLFTASSSSSVDVTVSSPTGTPTTTTTSTTLPPTTTTTSTTLPSTTTSTTLPPTTTTTTTLPPNSTTTTLPPVTSTTNPPVNGPPLGGGNPGGTGISPGGPTGGSTQGSGAPNSGQSSAGGSTANGPSQSSTAVKGGSSTKTPGASSSTRLGSGSNVSGSHIPVRHPRSGNIRTIKAPTFRPTKASERQAQLAVRDEALAKRALGSAKSLNQSAKSAATKASSERKLARNAMKSAQSHESSVMKVAGKIAKDGTQKARMSRQVARLNVKLEAYLKVHRLTPRSKRIPVKLEKELGRVLNAEKALNKKIATYRVQYEKARATVLKTVDRSLAQQIKSVKSAISATKYVKAAAKEEIVAVKEQRAADMALAKSKLAKSPPDVRSAIKLRLQATSSKRVLNILNSQSSATSTQLSALKASEKSYSTQKALNEITLKVNLLVSQAKNSLHNAQVAQKKAQIAASKLLTDATHLDKVARADALTVDKLKQALQTLIPNSKKYAFYESKLTQVEQSEKKAISSANRAKSVAGTLVKKAQSATNKAKLALALREKNAQVLISKTKLAANNSAAAASQYEALAAKDTLLAQSANQRVSVSKASGSSLANANHQASKNLSLTKNSKVSPGKSSPNSKSRVQSKSVTVKTKSSSKSSAQPTLSKAQTLATQGLKVTMNALVSGTGSSSSKIVRIPGEKSASIALQFNFSIGSVFSGSHFAVSGNGLKPGSMAKVVLHSNPTVMAEIPVDSSGGFAQSVSVPGGVVDGSHHILVDGQGPTGTSVSDQWPLTVSPDGSVAKMVASPTVLFPPQPQVSQPLSGTKVIGGQVYSTYIPASHTSTVVSSLVGAFAIMGLMGAGGIGAGSGGSSGGDDGEEQDGSGGSSSGSDGSSEGQGSGRTREPGGQGGAEGDRGQLVTAGVSQSGHHGQIGHGNTSESSHAGASLASFEIEHSNVTHESKGRGDHSRFWSWMGIAIFDEWSKKIPEKLNPWSPMIGKLSNDGVYARAMAGPGSLLLPLFGVALGALALVSTSGQPVPPSFGIFTALVVLSAFDGLSGLLGGLVFGLGVLCSGGIDSASALRTLLGLCIIFFAAPVVMSQVRPARRLPAKDVGEWTDRFGDLIIGGLVAAWGIEKMIGTLPSLAGVSFGITSKESTVALAVLLAVIARMLLETVAVHHYPLRIKSVMPRELPKPSVRQQHISNLIRGGLIGFVAYAYLGNVWELYLGTAIGLAVGVMSIYSSKLPKVKPLSRYIPKGIVKTLVLLAVGTALGAVLKYSIHGGFEIMAVGFVVLSLPSYLVDFATLLAHKRHKWKVTWTYRISGAVAVCVAALLIVGAIKF